MSRLIDADAFVKRAKDTIQKSRNEGNSIMGNYLLELVVSEISYEPTVDAEPVVRCKDCKHSRNPNRKDYWENKACEGVLVCTNCLDSVRPEDGGYNFVDEDWFCADGEEK